LFLQNQELLSGNALRGTDERSVTKEDGDSVLRLYEESGMVRESPHIVRHLKLTGVFAEHIARERRDMRPYAHALRAMGFLRNIGTFLARGYQSRLLLSYILCEKLGVSEIFRDYLRPYELSTGPLRSAAYSRMNERDRSRILADSLRAIRRAITPKQRVLEYAGLRAKVSHDRILTFRQIQRTLQPTRENRNKYEESIGGPSIWMVDEDAHDRLAPEFSWAPINERLHQQFGSAVDRERKVQQRKLDEGRL
jgi:hypothetical protein